MANFLDSLGLGGGTDVYVAISPNNKMEMCIPEKNNSGIKAYAQTDLAYDDIAREIASYEEFGTKIQELFSKCGVAPQRANVHIGLPVVWFGHKADIQFMYDDEAIKNIIIGELEQNFVFKKKEPVPYWFEGEPESPDYRKIFYTAIQAEAIEGIREALRAIGANLASIECSVFAYLRSLYATGRTTTQIEANEYTWNIMIINNNGFQLYSMKNDKIMESYSEPLILNSYTGEDVYNAITDPAQIAILSSPANALVIISEVDSVSAEKLSTLLQFSGEIIPIEENKHRKSPVSDICYTLPEEDQLNVSMHVIGLFAGVGMLPWGAKFISEEDEEDAVEFELFGKTIKLTPKKALKYALLLLLITLIPVVVMFVLIGGMNKNANDELQALENQINEVTSQLSAYEKDDNGSFNPVKETEKVLKRNRLKIMSYAALGESIPKNLYLTYFMTGDDGYVDIQGCANSVEDVYIFFQNLKDSLVEAKLRLNKLDLKAGSLDTVINSNVSTVDTAPYVFEITNMSDAQLATFMNALNNETGEAQDGKSGDDTQAENEVEAQQTIAPAEPTN